WSRFKVKTFLDLLESDGMLEVKTTSKYTLITNAESVTELIKTESQQIQLIVNEQDKKLRMETI
ncbi:hypothetical protein Q179_02797, partial [Staphylococcus aureus M1177]